MVRKATRTRATGQPIEPDLRKQLSRPNSLQSQHEEPRVGESQDMPPSPQPPPTAPTLEEMLRRMIELYERGQHEHCQPPAPELSRPLEVENKQRGPTIEQIETEGGSRRLHPALSRLGPRVPEKSVLERLGERVQNQGIQKNQGVTDQLREPRNRRERREAARQRGELGANRMVELSANESEAETPKKPVQLHENIEELAREVRDLRQKLEGKENVTASSLLIASPFKPEILAYRTSIDFKSPEHSSFDGTGDPREHLVSYQARMQVIGVEEPLMCRAFLPTLKGAAQQWFLSLAPNSIGSFQELAECFLTNYAVNIKPRQNFLTLSEVKQDPGEPLRTYLGRWQREVQAIGGLEDQTLLTLFMKSLRMGKLFEDLHNQMPTTYAQAMQIARRRADTEEAVHQKRRQEGGTSSQKKPRHEEGRERKAEQGRFGRMDYRRTPEKVGMPQYQPSPAQQVHEVKPALPPPPPLKPGDRPNVFKPASHSPKYCRYHRSSTHTTEECAYLKQEIEALIQRGATPSPNQWRRPLPRHDEGNNQITEGSRNQMKRSGSEEERNWKHKPVINFIVGGPEGGDSSRSRKAWARQLYVGTVYGREDRLKKVCRETIIFTDDDLPRGAIPHRDALVISMDVKGTVVRRILVDTGSSVNVLYLNVFNQLGLARADLKPVLTPLAGFTGDSVEPEGSIRLPIEIGTHPNVRKMDMEFIVVDLACSHNMILGRPGLEDLGALISIEHLCMKFRTPCGIGVVRCDQPVARDCYLKACRQMGQKDLQVHAITEQNREEKIERAEPAEELEEIEIDPSCPEKRIKIGVGLTEEVKAKICQVLKEYKSVFAWGPEDMPGVSRSVITHRLAVEPGYRPVIQKKRYMANDRREFVKKEVETLMAAGHIREVKYPQWLANVVLVPKSLSWRMCVDYTDLNKACPKDPFPLPRIDQLVDETAGCALLSFMDAFRGYHQIFMHHLDEEKTAFITPDGVYCYKVMPFGLKNAGATYTRMVAKLFHNLLGKSMAAYVDDMLVKSDEEKDHARDLANCFQIMKRYDLKLNPKKCAFAVGGGKFLGYMVTKRGIEPNPEKVKAILDMQPPTSLKDLQRLTGRLAALSRFLSKSAEKALPFFATMKKREGFRWTEECQLAFEELKAYLTTSPLLSKPKERETLYLYLAASQKAVSSVLVREENQIQQPVYYVSRALKDAEIRYSPLEKVVYALVITARKLEPYFQAHPIKVLTDQPLASILRSPTSSGRLVKWAVELTQFGIEYLPRTSLKGQTLADFIVECTAREPKLPTSPEEGDWWEMHADGAASQKHCGGGVVLTTPEGFRLYYALEYGFKVSNNEAEYEAILGGLQLAKALGVERLRIRTDSRLVVGQVTGTCEAKNERLKLYKDRTEGLLRSLKGYELSHVPRVENTEADILSKITLGGVPEHLLRICKKEVIYRPSIDPEPIEEVKQITERSLDPIEHLKMFWIEDIRMYKEKGELPKDEAEAAKIRRRAPAYTLIEGRLYKRSFGGPMLRCLSPDEAARVIEETHRGICAAHQGAHILARKLILQGYYWPTMVRDCIDRVAKCAVCQAFARKETRPASFYTPITTAIPFAKWGIDLLGPLPQAPGRFRFCVVAIDYFTKWVEAEPLVTITEFQCRRFLWKKVICRFGLPEHLVSDNGRQFDCRPFFEFCQTYQIRHTKVSVAYPQANGQVENVNRTIVDGIRKKLSDLGGSWVEELDQVLWAYRTTPRRATGETPFSLAYGFEAKVPIEVMEPTQRVIQYDDDQNEESLQIEKNFLEERRDAAFCRMAEYQQSVKRYQDQKTKIRHFQVGDLVLRNREVSRPTEGGKFAIKWEGPYRVSKVIRPGTYRLETLEGCPFDRIWNSFHLKKFYQ